MSEFYEELKSGLSKIKVGNQVYVLQSWETIEEDRILAKEFIEKYFEDSENK